MESPDTKGAFVLFDNLADFQLHYLTFSHKVKFQEIARFRIGGRDYVGNPREAGELKNNSFV